MNLIFELHPNLQWHCGSVSEGKSCLRLTDTIATLPNGYQLMDGRLRAASGHRHSFPVCDQCAAKLRDAYTDEKIQLLNAPSLRIDIERNARLRDRITSAADWNYSKH
jgi:hypothetical protein